MRKDAVMRLLMIEGWWGSFVMESLHMWRAILGANVIGDGRAICYIAVIICYTRSMYQPAGLLMQETSSELSSQFLIWTYPFHE